MPYHNFTISFDNPTATYYPGSAVTGRVSLELNKAKNVRGVKIKFEGKAKVSWTKSESHRNSEGKTETRKVTYHAEEEYFKNKYYLTGSENSDIIIPVGQNVYPFKMILPQQLPTTFDSEHGHVRYTVKATLDRPWKTDYEAEANFTIVSHLDLNSVIRSKEPVKQETHKYFCCCCCKSGPLTLVVWLPQTGFVPGQDIPLTVEVDNASNVVVDFIKCKLKKHIKCIARTPKYDTKTSTAELADFCVEGVEAHGSKTVSKNLTVPQIPFVNLDNCSIIEVSFVVKIQIDPNGVHQKLEIEIPIILGTVPIHEGSGNANSEIPIPQMQPGFVQPTPPLYTEYPTSIIPGGTAYPSNPPIQPGPHMIGLPNQQLGFNPNILPYPSLNGSNSPIQPGPLINGHPNQQPGFNPNILPYPSLNDNNSIHSAPSAPPDNPVNSNMSNDTATTPHSGNPVSTPSSIQCETGNSGNAETSCPPDSAQSHGSTTTDYCSASEPALSSSDNYCDSSFTAD